MTSIEPVGATEIAARAGVGRPTVEAWQRRHEDFPPARWTVGGRPAWEWADVRDWLLHTGRLECVRNAPTGYVAGQRYGFGAMEPGMELWMDGEWRRVVGVDRGEPYHVDVWLAGDPDPYQFARGHSSDRRFLVVD